MPDRVARTSRAGAAVARSASHASSSSSSNRIARLVRRRAGRSRASIQRRTVSGETPRNSATSRVVSSRPLTPPRPLPAQHLHASQLSLVLVATSDLVPRLVVAISAHARDADPLSVTRAVERRSLARESRRQRELPNDDRQRAPAELPPTHDASSSSRNRCSRRTRRAACGPSNSVAYPSPMRQSIATRRNSAFPWTSFSICVRDAGSGRSSR